MKKGCCACGSTKGGPHSPSKDQRSLGKPPESRRASGTRPISRPAGRSAVPSGRRERAVRAETEAAPAAPDQSGGFLFAERTARNRRIYLFRPSNPPPVRPTNEKFITRGHKPPPAAAPIRSSLGFAQWPVNEKTRRRDQTEAIGGTVLFSIRNVVLIKRLLVFPIQSTRVERAIRQKNRRFTISFEARRKSGPQRAFNVGTEPVDDGRKNESGNKQQKGAERTKGGSRRTAQKGAIRPGRRNELSRNKTNSWRPEHAPK